MGQIDILIRVEETCSCWETDEDELKQVVKCQNSQTVLIEVSIKVVSLANRVLVIGVAVKIVDEARFSHFDLLIFFIYIIY